MDNYLGACIVPCFHWFRGNVASEGYIPQMTARAKELGTEIRYGTPLIASCWDFSCEETCPLCPLRGGKRKGRAPIPGIWNWGALAGKIPFADGLTWR